MHLSSSLQTPRLTVEDFEELLQQTEKESLRNHDNFSQAVSSMGSAWFDSLKKVLAAKYKYAYKEFSHKEKGITYSVSFVKPIMINLSHLLIQASHAHRKVCCANT